MKQAPAAVFEAKSGTSLTRKLHHELFFVYRLLQREEGENNNQEEHQRKGIERVAQ